MDDRPRDVSKRLALRRVGLALVTVGALAGVVASVAVLLVVRAARSPTCQVARHEPLTLDQLVDVKRRFERYRADPTQGFHVTGEELAMLVEEQGGTPVFLDLKGDRLRGEVALPAEGGGCYPLRFEGELTIDGGRAYVVPHEVHVGSIDLGPFLAQRRIELLPEDMPSGRTAAFLRQTRHAEVHSGSLQVELQSPESFRLDGR